MLLPAFFISCTVAIGDISTIVVPGAPPRVDWQTYGTGFFYGYVVKDDVDASKREYEIYLVTAKHVVADRGVTKVRLNPTTAAAAGKQFEIPAKATANEKTWFFHPNPNIDVAVVRTNFNPLKEQNFAVDFFAQDEHAIRRDQMTELGVAAGDGIFVLGFPMNLAGQQRNYVIVRQGIISRISEMLENASISFLIDSFVFPGNSGGPVVLRPEIAAIQGTKSLNRAALIGIVTQSRSYVDTAISPQTKRARITFEENAGLADILPVDFIDETITELRKSEGLPPTQRLPPSNEAAPAAKQ